SQPVRKREPLRSGIRRVVSHLRSEWETCGDGEDTRPVPPADNQIGNLVVVQYACSLAEGKQIVETRHPAVFLLVVRQTFEIFQVVAVVRPWLVAADRHTVVYAAAKSVGAQEIQPVAQVLLQLDLQRIKGGIAPHLDGGETRVEWIRPPLLRIAR